MVKSGDFFDVNKLRKDVKDFLHKNYMSLDVFKRISKIDKAVMSRFLNGNEPSINAVVCMIYGMGKNIADYELNSISASVCEQVEYLDTLSIDELDKLIKRLTSIRDKKIIDELERLHNEIAKYESQMKDES